MKLKLSCWWDYDDPEHLIYFEIYDGKTQVWDSSWYDIREFNEDKLTIKELKMQVEEACIKYNIKVDLSSDDYWDWK